MKRIIMIYAVFKLNYFHVNQMHETCWLDLCALTPCNNRSPPARKITRYNNFSVISVLINDVIKLK